MKTVYRSLNRGGSGKGISYYETGMRCPRRAQLGYAAHLKKKAAQEGREKPVYGVFNPDKINAAGAGTVFHDLAEIYHTRRESEVCLIYNDLGAHKTEQEGRRVFAAYSKIFPPDAWGEVLHAELDLLGEDETLKARVKEVFGVELTARLDLVTQLHPEQAEELYKLIGLRLEPGIYIVDHKTKSRAEDFDDIFGDDSRQFIAYPILWDICNPGRPCKGMIANIVIRYAKMDFPRSYEAVFVPPPGPERTERLASFLKMSESLIETNAPFITDCRGRYGVCPFKVSGECNRR